MPTLLSIGIFLLVWKQKFWSSLWKINHDRLIINNNETKDINIISSELFKLNEWNWFKDKYKKNICFSSFLFFYFCIRALNEVNKSSSCFSFLVSSIFGFSEEGKSLKKSWSFIWQVIHLFELLVLLELLLFVSFLLLPKFKVLISLI